LALREIQNSKKEHPESGFQKVALCTSREGKSKTTIKQGQQQQGKENNHNNQSGWVRNKHASRWQATINLCGIAAILLAHA